MRRENQNNNVDKDDDSDDLDLPIGSSSNNNNNDGSSSGSLPPRRLTSTDDPSQLTEASLRSGRSNRSSLSYEHIRTVVHQASEILMGRLPSTIPDDPDRPRTVQVASTRSAGDNNDDNHHNDDEFHDATEHAVAEPLDVPINFLQDPVQEMTWSRRIALSLADKTWYNPSIIQNIKIQQEESERGQHSEASFAVAPPAAGGNNNTTSATDNGNDVKQPPRGGRAQDAYPFTVSKREQPSLAKAWACKCRRSRKEE